MYTIESTLPLIIYAIYVPIIFVIYIAQVVIVLKNKRKAQFRSSYFTLFIIEAFTVLMHYFLKVFIIDKFRVLAHAWSPQSLTS